MLLALGFTEKEVLEGETSELCLVLEEPRPEDDFEFWAEWCAFERHTLNAAL